MDDNWMIFGIIALICEASVIKAYLNSKTRHFVVNEIDRLRERVEVLERQIVSRP